ncbi:MAG: HepT-like ribonuclease domain-containing protein [Terriglobia bacterium]
MSKSDLIRLRHMLEAAREAVKFAEHHSLSDLSQNPLWALGLVKCLEIVGEAAARISLEARAECPEIPWAPMVAMRNRLVHVYFDVDFDQIWKALTDDLPPLISQLSKILDAADQRG